MNERSDILSNNEFKDNPYYKYITDRTNELLKSFVDKCHSNDRTACIKFVGLICQSLAMNEADVMENQAMLNDPSPYHDGTRDELLKMFGKQFIDNKLSKGNRTYADFDKKRYMNGGDNQ